jgi:hypothetical protein
MGEVCLEKVVSGRILAFVTGVYVWFVSQGVLIFFSGLFITKKMANNDICRSRLAGESDFADEIPIVWPTAIASKPAPTDLES